MGRFARITGARRQPTAAADADTTAFESPPAQDAQTRAPAADGQPSGPAPPPPEPPPAAEAPPAGVEPDATNGPPPPSFRDRNRLRRRLQFLRRARELGLRDLGGLVFDTYRFGRRREDLVTAKVATLWTVDWELRTLESVLNDRQDVVILRESGISACPRCGALHGSDANYCPNCGLQVGGEAAVPVTSAPAPGPALAAALPPASGEPAVLGAPQGPRSADAPADAAQGAATPSQPTPSAPTPALGDAAAGDRPSGQPPGDARPDSSASASKPAP